MNALPQNRVGAILAALTIKMQEGYVDGYMYDADDWDLVKLFYQPDSQCYYALIELEAAQEDYNTALFEIYGELSDVEMLDSEINHVGFNENYLAADVVEVE